MNNGRRIAASFAAQFIDDSFEFGNGPSEDGYKALMALVSNLRSEEYQAVKNLARYRDKNEASATYHDVALQAFPLLQAADDELKAGLKTGEWDPDLVTEKLRAASQADGTVPKAKPKTRRKK